MSVWKWCNPRMGSGGVASGSPLSARNACSRLSPSAPTTNTIGSDRPSLVVTIGDPAPATEAAPGGLNRRRGVDANFQRDQTRPPACPADNARHALEKDETPRRLLQTAGDVMAMFVVTPALATAPPTPPRLSRSRR